MRRARTTRSQVPTFSLYGESRARGDGTDAIHIEDIASRSRRYLWKIGTHLHRGKCQCVYLETGAVVTDLEDSRTTRTGPVVICVPAGTVHAFAFQADSQGYVLTIDLTRVLSDAGISRQAPIAELFSGPHIIDLAGDAGLAARTAQIFGSLLHEFRQPDFSRSPVACWLACSVLWILATHPGAASTAAMNRQDLGRHDLDRLRRFRRLIELHYLQHWSVERYARCLALSSSSLNRLCQSVARSTAFDVIQQRLALEARRRLVYVPESIASIAVDLGFKDPAYFSRFFRKHVGVSPGDFRRRQGAGG